MAAILGETETSPTVIKLSDISDLFEDDFENEVEDFKLDSEESKEFIWIKENDIYRGSVNVSLQKTLDPGIYTVDVSRDYGFFCKKVDIKTDELYMFSDSLSVKILKEINLFWNSYDKFKEKNLVHKRGILLEGPAGTGKSSIVTMLSAQVIQSGGVVFKISDYRNFLNYMGFLHNSFKKIQPTTPIITILEDIDQYDDVMPNILDFLDGKNSVDRHVIIATTNNSEKLEDNLIRPSRLDLVYLIDLPSKDHRREYFKFKKVPDEDLELLIEESETCSLADLKEIYICRYLLNYTIVDAIDKVKNPRKKTNYLKRNARKSKLGL